MTLHITSFKSITLFCGTDNIMRIFPTFKFLVLLSVPQNNVMDLNNVMHLVSLVGIVHRYRSYIELVGLLRFEGPYTRWLLRYATMANFKTNWGMMG